MRINRAIPLFGLLLSVGLYACSGTKQNTDTDLLAEAYGNKLYKQDVQKALGDRAMGGDSTFLYQEYVQTWVKKQAILHKAMESLSEEDKDKQAQLEAYRDDLIMYEYEKSLLERNLDLEIKEVELLEYYRNNQKNFELKENIVKLIFFKLPKSVKRLDRHWSKFVGGKDKDIENLTRLSVESGGNFNRDEDKWFSFNDILKEIPINTYNQENYLSNHKNIRTEDAEYVYFVKILSFRIKNNISPYEFEKDKIESILINKRKTELLKQLQEKIVQEAYDKNEIEIFSAPEIKTEENSNK